MWTTANLVTIVAYAVIPVALLIALYRAKTENLPRDLVASIMLISAFVWACSVDHAFHGPPVDPTGLQHFLHLFEAGVSALTAVLFVSSTGALGAWLQLRSRNEMQAELIRKLETANRDLSDFARASSHDLRAPIRNVLSYAELLEEAAPEEGAQYVERIKESALHMHGLLEGMLAYSGLRSGALKRSDVDMDALCSRIKRDLPDPDRLVFNGLGTIYADPVQMDEALSNLISNAAKYSPTDSPITVHTERSPGEVRISVRDTGIGIDERHIPSIFEPFARLDSRTDGAGLGLAIVSRVAERHGGSVSVQSRVGAGSTFTLTIPHGSD